MNEEALRRDSVKKTFYRFLLPTMISSVSLAVISLTDMAIAGHFLGKDALSAISIALPVILAINILSALLGSGAAIFISTQLGKGNKKECAEIFTNACFFALLISVIITILGNVFTREIIFLCGAADAELQINAEKYIRPILIGFVPMVFSPILNTFLRNDSKPNVSMRIVIVTGLLNLVGDVYFAAVLKMGLTGIAAASVIAQTLSAVAAGIILLKKSSVFRLVKTKISFKYLRSMISPGLPMAMIFLLQILLTSFINRTLVKCGGVDGVASYAVIKYIITFIYALFDGVTGAVQPMLGIYFGEGEKENIKTTSDIGLKAILIIGISLTVILELFAPQICKILGAGDSELAGTVITAVRIQAVYCISAAAIAFLNSYYRCTGHEMFSMIITILNNCVFPFALISVIAYVTNYSVYSVYLGLVASDIVTLLFWLILRKAAIKETQTEDKSEVIFTKIIPLEEQNVSILLETVEKLCEEYDFSPKISYYISICMEEMVVNTMQLAKIKGKEYNVDVKITRLTGGDIVIRIRDDCIEFDPTVKTADSALEAAEEESFNLLGIGIVKNVAKEYDYKRTIGFNNFRIVL